jgi:hypothetical protein
VPLLLKCVQQFLLHSVIGLKKPGNIDMPGPNTVPHARPQADSAESAPTRRRFLMGAAVAAAAAGTAATASHLVQAPAAPAASQADPADDGATGYRLSEHIRKYYKTTWI